MNRVKEALAIVGSTERTGNLLEEHFYSSRPQTVRIQILSNFYSSRSQNVRIQTLFQKKLPRVTSLRVLRWEIKLMTFDFDILYVKGKTIRRVESLSRRKFGNEKVKNHKNTVEKIQH